jgi:hypothetical protein
MTKAITTSPVPTAVQVPTLYLFTVEYHDGVDWEWKSFDLIAVDEEQVLTYINNQRSADCRTTTYRSADEPLDSLTIENKGVVQLPFKLER